MPEPWLFDVYPHPRTSHLVVWTKHGRDVRKRLVPYRPHFCVAPDTMDLAEAERLLADDGRVARTWRDRTALWLRGPDHEVLRVQPKRLQDMHAVATDLRKRTRCKGLRFFDVDDQPESRWMHEHDLFSMCRLRVEGEDDLPDGDAAGHDGPGKVCQEAAAGPDGPGNVRLEAAPDEDRWSLDHPDPHLTALRLGVEVEAQGNIPDFDDPLALVRLGYPSGSDDEAACGSADGGAKQVELRCTAPGDPDAERDVLLELGRRIRKADPDVIITRHGDRFDVPYLLRRIRSLGLEHQVWLGREPDIHPDTPDQQSKSIHTYGRWLYKTHAYYLRGRWHIDLSKKTLDSEDDRKDLWGILYLARVSNRRAQDVNRNGAGYALQQMQIDAAVDMGVALPWKRNLAEDWKDAATLCAVDRGGQIMVPTPGIYEDVAACDFSGYYPSLVVRHNLSSDTINCQCCPDGPVIPELGYHVCQKHHGHQAEVLRRLAPHRKRVKAILRRAKTSHDVDPDLAARAKAVKSEHKALGVVCFGYFRYRNARFGCAEVHQAIQAYGRDGMTRARALAQRHGYDMVHMMTDCVFMQRPGTTRVDAMRMARRIMDEVGVPMDVEGVYRWIVFLPSKTHSRPGDPTGVGVPNRYYGKFEDGSLKVRGIEVQRHSTPDWIHDVQQAMLDVLQEADDAQGFQMRIPRALDIAKDAAHALRRREVDPRCLGTMVQSTRSVEEYRANTNTQAALKRLRDAGTERRPGEYVKYVVARREGAWEGRTVPVELWDQDGWFGGGVSNHVLHYLQLLARSVETLLSPFGYEEDGLLAWLAGGSDRPHPASPRRVDLPPRPDWVSS